MLETFKEFYMVSAFIMFLFYTFQLSLRIEKKLNYFTIFITIFLPIYNTVMVIKGLLKIVEIFGEEREKEIKHRGRR